MQTPTMENSYNEATAKRVRVRVSVKKLSQVHPERLLTDLLQRENGEVKMKLSVFLKNNLSEGTLEDFFNVIKSGDHIFTYCENVDLVPKLLKDYNLKWDLESETFPEGTLEGKIAGVNSPTLYFGKKYSAFPFHREDADLRSLSFLISGSPKVLLYINILTSTFLFIFLDMVWNPQI